MSTITDKLTYLQDTKTAIKNAIVNKGVSVSDSDTFRSYANKISSITTGEGGGSSDEWQPESDWWDIDAILENDTEEYEGKIIALIGNEFDTTKIYTRNADKIVTSDGKTYENTPSSNLDLMQSTTYTHTWDKTKDKDCSLGYKTRYIIWYYSSSLNNKVNISPKFTENPIYMIIKNLSKLNMQINSNNPCFYSLETLIALKGINTCFVQPVVNFGNCPQLEYLEGFSLLEDLDYTMGISACNFRKLPNIITNDNVGIPYNGLQNIPCLEEIDNVTISGGNTTSNLWGLQKVGTITWTSPDLRNIFNSCNKLKKVDKLILPTTVTTVSSGFNGSYSLRHIGEINTIVASNAFNFTYSTLLNHDTLIRILNALYDYASEGSTSTYILTLGATNLAKLTDEEKAIATNKGWTLN